MPVLFVLLVFVLAFLFWRWRMTSLTRNCRWREDRRVGGWHCVFCGARMSNAVQKKTPTQCMRHRVRLDER